MEMSKIRVLQKSLSKIVLLIAAVVAVVGITPLAASASPSVSCYGDYCSGRDPVQTGCANDAYTVTSYNDAYASLQLRWSPTCKTNWARLVVYPTGNWSAFNYGLLVAHQDTGYEQSTDTPIVTGTTTSTTFWTPMIYSPVHCVKAVFYNAYHTYDEIQTGCY
jgi:hypothetical protein